MALFESSKSRYRKYRALRGFFGQKKQPHDRPPFGGPNGPQGPGPNGAPPNGGKGPGPNGMPGSSPKPPALDGEVSRHRKLFFYLKRYFKNLIQFKRHIIVLISIGFLSLALNAAGPWASKFMLDFVFTHKKRNLDAGAFINNLIDNDKPGLLFWLCIILLVCGVGEMVFHSISEYTSSVLSAKMEVGIRRLLIRHLQVMSLSKIERLKTGGIISRLEGDVGNFSALLHQGLLAPLNGLMMFAIGLGSLVLVSPITTLICLIFIIALMFAAYYMFNIMRPLFRDLQEDRSRISGRLAETFGGIRVVRVFGRETHETNDFITAHNLLIRKSLHTNKMHIGIHRTMDTFNWGMKISIWAVGGTAVLKGKMSIGDLMVFTQFVQWFFHPVFMIMFNITHVQSSVACTERIYDMLDEPVDIQDKPDASDIRVIDGDISFNDVSFAYEPEKPVLKHLNLTIPKGKTVALVGPSGAGKTTITNLLVRFYDPNEGTITLDGKTVDSFKLSDYRGLFSLVLQDVFLFDGTIAENISYSVPFASSEDIVAAAKIAAADDFIQEFPDKYNTIIGERGVKLSGGQKQRVSLARAILRNPQLLILDEATSSLDSQSEALIQEALKNILKNRTTLVIAHRLSTIIDADIIAVVIDGTIVEQGTHEELLAKGGHYAEMFNKQMGKGGSHLNWGDESSEEETPEWKKAAMGHGPMRHGPHHF